MVVVRQVQKLERHLTFVYAKLKGGRGAAGGGGFSTGGAQITAKNDLLTLHEWNSSCIMFVNPNFSISIKFVVYKNNLLLIEFTLQV